jgi:transcriptional regulator with XRE-family HTH domain
MPSARLANHIVPGLNDRLRQERERLGVSQDKLARLLGVSRVTQNYYESGSREPSISYLSAFGQNGGNLLYLLFADDSPREYVDLIDWDLIEKVWDWVERVAVDSKGKPYPRDLQKKAFRLAYRACRSCKISDPKSIDLTVLLGKAA